MDAEATAALHFGGGFVRKASGDAAAEAERPKTKKEVCFLLYPELASAMLAEALPMHLCTVEQNSRRAAQRTASPV